MAAIATTIAAGSALLAMLALSYCSSGPPDGNPNDFLDEEFLVEVHVNQPGANRHVVVDPLIDERIIKLFDNAQESIYLSFYGFRHIGIAEALIRAVERGLIVEMTGDYTHYVSQDPGYVMLEEAVHSYPNARMTVGNSQSIMHNKWAVIDGQFVFSGTGNITNSGTRRNDNIWLIIKSKELAQDFLHEHRQMIAGRFGHAKEKNNRTHFCIGVEANLEIEKQINWTLSECQEMGGILVENWFSPQENAMQVFVNAVRTAEHDVNYMIFAFTHDDLGRAFINKHRQFVSLNENATGTCGLRDCYVRGALDRSQFSHAQYVEVYRLAGACGHELDAENNRCTAPMDMRRDGNENTNRVGDWQGGGGRLHSKAMIIDAVAGSDPKALVGSFNWSINANSNNDENMLVIHSEKITRQLHEKFNELYNNSPPLPGDEGDYQEVVISEINWAGSVRAICFDDEDPPSPMDYSRDCPNKNYFTYDGNEFVELYNPNDYAVNISYWSLFFPYQSDTVGIHNDSKAKRAVVGFPEGTIIPPGGIFVVWEPDQRNDIRDGYSFEEQEGLVVYSPYNNLSNFMSLYDRRNRDTNFTPCSPAFSYWVDGFPTSNWWGGRDWESDDGPFGFKVELHDNRGNLVDQTPEVSNNSRFIGGGFRGGFFSAIPEPGDPTPPHPNPTYSCGQAEADTDYTASMERLAPSGGDFGEGSDWNSWGNAQRAGSFIAPAFQGRTLATPGEENSTW